MDDADLEKLIVKPGKLKPKFNRNVVEYEIVLNSGINELALDPFTRDCNASWIIPGRGTERRIPITEGTCFELVIEVTAENGSTKNYTILITSLSSSSTYISTLKVKNHTLTPPFKPTVYQYECTVPCECRSIDFSVISPDKSTKIVIQQAVENAVDLNVGRTKVDVIVTSPDGTKSVTYYIDVHREKLLFPKNALKYQCPICLNVPHRPVSIATGGGYQDNHVFCESCVQTVTRVNKRHPLTNKTVDGQIYEPRDDVENELSQMNSACVLNCGGENNVLYSQYANHLKVECKNRLSIDEKSGMVVLGADGVLESVACPSCSRSYLKPEKTFHDSFICSSNQSYTFQHQIEANCKWQKNYQQGVVEQQIESDVMTCASKAQADFKALVQNGNKSSLSKDVLGHLEKACQLYAFAISQNAKNHQAHYKLGVMLEELSMMDDVYGIAVKKREHTNEDLDNGEFQSDESMEDDIKALAGMRGYGRTATTTQQLQALDQEYHHLLDQGQSEKADYVQKLYAFKQRQQHVAGKPLVQLQDKSLLHKALQKYEDACAVEPNAFLYQMHAGRLLLMLEKNEEALKRLRCAVSLKPLNSESRFYLGVAMCKMKENKRYSEEIVTLLTDGLKQLLYNTLNHKQHESLVEDFSCTHNTVLMDGVRCLLGVHNDKCFVDKISLWKYVCLLCMTKIGEITNRNGRSFNKYQLMLLHTQYEYGLYMKKTLNEPSLSEMRQYWKHLANVTLVFCGNTTVDTLNIQRQICEELVGLLPRSSEALANLASILSLLQEVSPKSVSSTEIELLFRASLEVEGTDIHQQDALPTHLEKTGYWCKRNTPSKTGEESSKVDKKQTGSTKQPTKNLPKPGANKTPTAKPVAATKLNKAAKKPVTSPASKVPAGKGAIKKLPTTTAPTRTSPMKASGVSKPLPAATRSKTNAARKSSSCCCSSSKTKVPVPRSTDPSPIATAPKQKTTKEVKVEINEKSVTARLGLARVLKQQQDSSSSFSSSSVSKSGEVEKLYNQVIEMAPDTHDAYIELGEILATSKPLDAVEVYCKFPFASSSSSSAPASSLDVTGSFDDGYLYGEIVRLLVKEGCFEDERLKKFMIELGRVMGFSSLEKYIGVLENKLKYNQMLREVYAGVNNKAVDDADLKAFFKFKCWE